MLLSKTCIYGLQAALLMAIEESDDYISIKEISEKLDSSFHFLTKTLQQLTAVGFLESYKGPRGGIRLQKQAEDISLLDIVLAIDSDNLFTRCVLGLPGCGTEKPCPLHGYVVTTERRYCQDAKNNEPGRGSTKGKG